MTKEEIDAKKILDSTIKENNPREILVLVADWLAWQTEALSDGLKCPQDAIKLWMYAITHDDTFCEMADEWDDSHLIAALGYNPLERARKEYYYGKSPVMVSI